ncbi:NAD-binding protein [Fomitiporia mediterranea MF3/22]|uniref:NAD-binding protein n=1 Tax=Fomitiporia mediterranea (strain MF3/22) TaxID=694068 RepID=UPI0004407848|nr:NAD-binding protein [Fomitiporia mediterranea MF3/22]EJD05226.1 NAD-binding protein [Fomitiporia mediterranea MF3/22]
MDLGLKDTRVLLTGANGGIGFVTVKLFLDQDADVVAHYNTSNSSLKELGGVPNFSTVQADLTQESDVLKLFDTIGDKSIQVLVVNHAIWPKQDAPIAQMSLEQWNKTVSTNLTGSFLVIREFLRRLDKPEVSAATRDKAAIVIIGSTAGKVGEAGHGDYSATKSALMYGFLLTLKNEIVKIAPKGRVNCVAPGWVSTPMVQQTIANPAVVYQALATTPMKKIATPSDVAHQIVVLASPIVSGHVTGQIIMVEGGMEGRLLNKPEDLGL